MIVYLANKTRFREDILSNRIEEIVHESLQGTLGKSVGASELASWKNSLRHMDTVLENAWIPDNAGVAIEFNIPQTGKRVDFIVNVMHHQPVQGPRTSLGNEGFAGIVSVGHERVAPHELRGANQLSRPLHGYNRKTICGSHSWY